MNNSHLVGRPHYRQCNACRRKFTVCHGTPFEGTHLPLRSWFTALYLIAASSKGISSVKLGEHLGVGQKTAWFLGQRIRRMMEDKDALLRGVVEVDETYLAGKRRRRRASRRDPDDQQPTGRGGSRRKMVMVATERGGRARASKGETHSERTIVQFILQNLDIRGRIVLCTDALPAYRWIGSKFPAHLWVNHSAGEYVRRDPGYAADAHTNTAESFNAMLKRAVMGVWHWFSIKHTDRYLHELCFRWNRRGTTAEYRLHRIFIGMAPRLRWRELVA